jgi:glucokinase
MEAIGIDVTAHAARAVTVGAGGKVLGAASYEGSDPLSALDAAVSAIEGRDGTMVGIAIDDPALMDAASRRPLPGGVRSTLCRAGDAAVVAEEWIGASKGARHIVCLWLGDRVLAGVLLNGKLWRGAHGLAGFAAWLALNPVERQDYRKYGSFAAEANDRGIARRLAWRVQAGDESNVVRSAGGLEAITAAHVFDGARASDGVAMSVVRDTARYIAMAAVNLAVAIDPEIIVIAGPITAARDLLLEPTRQDLERRLPPPMVGQVRCEFSPLGADGVAVGAARIAMLARA